MIEKPSMYKVVLPASVISKKLEPVIKKCFTSYESQKMNNKKNFVFGPYTADVLKTKMLEMSDLSKQSNQNLYLTKEGADYVIKNSE